jgi:hypothetical protein
MVMLLLVLNEMECWMMVMMIVGCWIEMDW